MIHEITPNPGQKIGKMSITEFGVKLKTDFYDDKIVNTIKKFSRDRRKWINDEKAWLLNPATPQESKWIKKIMKNKLVTVTFNESELDKITGKVIDKKQLITTLSEAIDGVDSVTHKLKLPLREYQKVAHRYIELVDGKALIADEMGTGKTIEALSYISTRRGRTVIVCPSSVKMNWKREIHRFINPNHKVQIVRGRTDELKNYEFTIINYDILKWYVNKLKNNVTNLIVDECHYIKSRPSKRLNLTTKKTKIRGSQRTKAVLMLGESAKRILCLSGTPLKNNRPIELWPVIQLLKKQAVFGGYWDFVERYCGAYQDRFGWHVDGIRNVVELHDILKRTFMIRRLKSQVLKELPPKQHTVLVLDDLDLTEYNKVSNNFRTWIKSQGKKWPGRAGIVVQIEYLKQAVARAKLKSVTEWIGDFLESSTEKILIFINHRDIQEQIYQKFKTDAMWIRSGNDQSKIDEFKSGNKQIAIISLMAGGVGLNLQEANNVLFVELGWTPDTHVQAEDRTHRMGQDKPVSVYTMIGKDTIDETIYELIKEKEKGISSILDDGEVTFTKSIDIALELWKEFGGEISRAGSGNHGNKHTKSGKNKGADTDDTELEW